MCILCVLLIVVNYYDLSVLSMSVMGFQTKKFGWGQWVGTGWGELHPSLLWICGIFLTLVQGPLLYSCVLLTGPCPAVVPDDRPANEPQ